MGALAVRARLPWPLALAARAAAVCACMIVAPASLVAKHCGQVCVKILWVKRAFVCSC